MRAHCRSARTAFQCWIICTPHREPHMTIETQDDIVALKRIGRIVSLTLQHMLDAAEPGMTTRDLDLLGEQLLEEHGARSAPRLTYNFPGATCISINEQAAHGIPGDR